VCEDVGKERKELVKVGRSRMGPSNHEKNRADGKTEFLLDLRRLNSPFDHEILHSSLLDNAKVPRI